MVWEKSETTSYFKQLPIYTSPIIFIQETIFDPTSISDLSGSGKKILNHISTLPFKLLSCVSSISILDRLPLEPCLGAVPVERILTLFPAKI